MKASEAKAATSRALARKHEIYRKEQEGRIAKEKLEIAKALKDEYPKFIYAIRKKIQKATSEGSREADLSYGAGAGANAMAAKAITVLEADGYSVKDRYWEGYEQYGDTEAPCNIWETRRWLEISW